MHGSLNILVQRVGKIGMRSSLQTDELIVPSNDTSSKSGPPALCTVPRISIVSLPAPGTFVDLCGSQGPSKNVPPDYFSMRTERKPTEMPLSCHPPFRTSWLEVQPSQTHIPRPKAHHRADIGYSNTNASTLEDGARKESPEAKTSRRYHGIILPPPPPIPHTRQRRKRSHSKPYVATSQDTTPINLFEQPIAPLTPHHLKSATPHPVRSPRSSATYSKTQHNPAASINANRYNAKPPALRYHRVDRRSPHVVLADDSLELKVFSELDDELDEVMSLYTGSETS